MAKVEKVPKKKGFSISFLATEFGMDRATVSKRLSAGGVDPVGKVNGYAVYSLAEAVKALFGLSVERTIPASGGGDEIDPDQLKPFEMKAYWQAQREKAAFARERGELVPAAEVEAELAKVCKLFASGLDSLPDELEGALGLKPDQVHKVEARCDALRRRIHKELTDDDD